MAKKKDVIDESSAKLLSRIQVYQKEGELKEIIFEHVPNPSKVRLSINTLRVGDEARGRDTMFDLDLKAAKRIRAMLDIHIKCLSI
jgi:hypothetical protein